MHKIEPGMIQSSRPVIYMRMMGLSTRTLGLTQITLGSRLGSKHSFALQICALNIILNRGSRSDLISNTLTSPEAARTLRMSMQLLNI